MDPKYIDENDFFELYHNQIESGKLEGEAFEYAIDLIREKAESDTVAYFRRLEKIYYYLLQYKYFPEKQGAYWVMQIRKHTSELQFLNRVSTPALRKKVEFYDHKWFSRAKLCICLETRTDPSTFPGDIPDEWTLDTLADDDFIESFLEEYAGKR